MNTHTFSKVKGKLTGKNGVAVHAPYDQRLSQARGLSAKQLLQFALVTGVLFLFDSCCTKKDCNGFEKSRIIELVNYAASDSDTVSVEIFTTNSSFANRVDSNYSVAYPSLSGDQEVALYLSDRIYTDRDYRITLQSTGQVFEITHIKTTKRSCNSCPLEGEADLYETLGSYSVNGIAYYDHRLKIWM